MTPKERLMARLEGKPVDKIPNLSIVMLFAAKTGNVKYGDFCYDYRALAQAQTKTAKEYGLDILSTMSDPFREVHDWGANVIRQDDDLPHCTEAFIDDLENLDKLVLWDPLTSTRMLDRIRAVEYFKKESGDEYPILGWVEGPWAEFTDLTTISEGMVMLLDDPDNVQKAMEIITEQEIRCALAQVEAGADIIGIGDAAASLISPDAYLEHVFPLEKKIIEAVHKAGAKTKLHICGNITHLLQHVVATGSDIVDIDYMVDWKNAVQQYGDVCSICGNINPTEVIMQGTVEKVREQTRFCAQNGNSKSIISSGCEVPISTPPANLAAIDAELKDLAAKA